MAIVIIPAVSHSESLGHNNNNHRSIDREGGREREDFHTERWIGPLVVDLFEINRITFELQVQFSNE